MCKVVVAPGAVEIFIGMKQIYHADYTRGNRIWITVHEVALRPGDRFFSRKCSTYLFLLR